MVDFELTRPAEFALAESAAFLTGFRAMAAESDTTGLSLAFALDNGWEAVGLHLSQSGPALVVEVISNPDRAEIPDIQQNLDRLLGLSLDYRAFRAIGDRDPVVAKLQQEHPAVRPVHFPTAWEAAVWSILCQRTRRVQAVAIKRRIAESHGNAVIDSNGAVIHGFPGPGTVRGLSEIRGLPLQKIEWLHGLADATLAGQLDCQRLANLGQEDGMRLLQTIPGIGPFSSELILARGAGNPDIFPMNEPMLHEIMTRLYGVSEKERHRQIAEHWRPYRSWVSFLLRFAG